VAESGALTQVEHEAHETSIDIVINGTPRTVHERKLSYEQVVDLAYDGNPPSGPNTMIVVTFSRGQSPEKGTLVAGLDVPVHKGMVFNVYDATES